MIIVIEELKKQTGAREPAEETSIKRRWRSTEDHHLAKIFSKLSTRKNDVHEVRPPPQRFGCRLRLRRK